MIHVLNRGSIYILGYSSIRNINSPMFTCDVLHLYTIAMFGNNAFGALGVESNQQAGPSRKQVQGDEIDVDVSHSPQPQDAS